MFEMISRNVGEVILVSCLVTGGTARGITTPARIMVAAEPPIRARAVAETTAQMATEMHSKEQGARSGPQQGKQVNGLGKEQLLIQMAHERAVGEVSKKRK
jgi:hypothetical protein